MNCNKLLPLISTVCLISVTSVSAFAQGGIWVTGHDSDWHALYGTGPQHIVQTSVNYVTNHKANPKILFVSDNNYIGYDSRDTQSGLGASGFTNYTIADDGTTYLDVSTVNFANYDAIVVASSGGGLLHQSELDKLNARAADIVKFINGGGGLVAFSESNGYPGGTTHDYYGFLPFVIPSLALPQGESTFQVTSFGAGLGLVDSDVNSAFAHNTFTQDSGLNVVDRDNYGQGNIISLAFYGTIGIHGVTPEPGTVALFISAGIAGGSLLMRRRRK